MNLAKSHTNYLWTIPKEITRLLYQNYIRSRLHHGIAKRRAERRLSMDQMARALAQVQRSHGRNMLGALWKMQKVWSYAEGIDKLQPQLLRNLQKPKLQ